MRLEILIVLLIVLAVVTVVGHIIWLLVAGVLKMIFQPHLLQKSPTPGPPDDSKSPISQDLPAFQRILKYLHWKGWILSAEKDRFIEMAMRAQEELDSPTQTQFVQQSPLVESPQPHSFDVPAIEPAQTPLQTNLRTDHDADSTDPRTSLAAPNTDPTISIPAEGSTHNQSNAANQTPIESLYEKALTRRQRFDPPHVQQPAPPHLHSNEYRQDALGSNAANQVPVQEPWTDDTDSTYSLPSRSAPRRALSEVLQSFLIEHNIRWGELAAGILIVVCSVGLVMSLWSKLTETNRLLPAAIFLTAVAAIEAAGLYTLKRWKLRHTSRAILIIATMLVPLAMMAGISIAASGDNPVSLTSPLTIFAITIGSCCSITLLYFSGSALLGKALQKTWTWNLSVPTILLPFASAMAFRNDTNSNWLMLAAAIAVSSGLLFESTRLNRRRSTGHFLPAKRNRQLLFLGLSTYTIVVLANMFFLRGQRTLDFVIPLSIAAVPVAVVISSFADLLASRFAAGNYRTMTRALNWLTLFLSLTLLPLAMKQFEWVTAWALLFGLSGMFAGIMMRLRWPPLLFTVAATLWIPLATSVWITGNQWSGELPLWRRYIGGHSALAVLSLSAALLGVIELSRLLKIRSLGERLHDGLKPFGLATSWISIFGLVITGFVGLGPEEWLDSIPRPIFTVILGAVAIYAALFHGRLHLGRMTSQALLACSVLSHFFNADVWFDRPHTEWSHAITFSLGVITLSIAIIGELSNWRFRESLAAWWYDASLLGCVTVVSACITFHAAPQHSIGFIGTASLLLLVSSLRNHESKWLTGAYISSGIAVTLATIHIQPAWLKQENAWRTLDGYLYVTTITAMTLTGWSILQDVASIFGRQFRSTFAEDKIKLRRYLSFLLALAIVSLLSLNAALILISHAKHVSPNIADKGAFLWGIASIILLTISQLWPFAIPVKSRKGMLKLIVTDRMKGARFNGLQFSDYHVWVFTLALIPILGTGTSMPYLFGNGTRGIVALGWVTVATTFVCLAFNCSICWAALRLRDGLNQLTSAFACSLIVGTCGALFAANHPLASPGDQPPTWFPQTIVAWTALCLFGWSILAYWTNRSWPTSITAGIAAASAQLLAFWFNPRASIETLLAAPCAAMLALFGIEQLLDRYKVKQFFYSKGWQNLLPENSASTTSPPTHISPIILSTILAIGFTYFVAARAIIGGFTSSWDAPDSAWIWTCLAIASTIAASSPTIRSLAKSHFTKTQILLFGWLIGSGLLTATLTQWRWIPDQAQPFTLCTLWLAGAIATGLNGLSARSWKTTAVSFAIAFIVLINSAFEKSPQYPWFILGTAAALWCFFIGLALASHVKKLHLGQTLSAAAAASLVLLILDQPSMTWSKNGSITAGIALLSLGLVWRSLNFLGFVDGSQSLFGTLFRGPQNLALVPTASQAPKGERLWIDTLLIGGMLFCFIPVYIQTFSDHGSMSAIRIIAVVAALALATVSAIARISSDNSVILAFLCAHAATTLAVIRCLPESTSIETISVFMVTWVATSGLWIWNWPSISRLAITQLRADERVGQMGLSRLPCRFPLVITQALTLVSAMTLSVYTILGPFNPASSWLVICSAAAMAALIGNVAEWFDSYQPRSTYHSNLLRYVATLSIAAVLVIASLDVGPNTQPHVLMICMRLIVVSIMIPSLAMWVIPKALRLPATLWKKPLQASAMTGVAIGTLTLPVMLITELSYRGSDMINSTPTPLVIGIGFILGIAALLLAIAGLFKPGEIRVLPELTDSQRKTVLYVAQALAAIAWLHVYLCRPELAMAGLRPYWPYLVMGVAFLSAGLSHWGVTRQDLPVSQTMKQTSLFLPLIPVIGFWLSNNPDNAWQFLAGKVSYVSLLIAAAIFYGILALAWSKEKLPRYAGIIMANAALWAILVQQPSLAIFEHPQFWLIPPALCVLAVVHFDRNSLPQSSLAPVRYACMLVIYVSSTADLMLSELGATLFGPIVLILFALLGMLAGVILRTRAYLYLGTIFVLIGVLSMVWNAGQALEQNWPWWVFGITTGCLILGCLLAIEKNKPKIRGWIQTLNSWDA